MKEGNLHNNVCIKDIDKIVQSQNAHCHVQYDRKQIRDAIRSKSLQQGGFDSINKAVERIRLYYLLDLSIDDILKKCKDEERQRNAAQLLFSSVTMLVNRVYFLSINDEIPNSEDYSQTLSGFSKWRNDVKRILKELDNSSSDSHDAYILF